MPKHAVAFACLSAAALAAGCTARGSDMPDAFMAIPIPDASATDTATGTDANRGDTGARADASDSGSACGTLNLHSDVGASIAMGTTTSGMDRHTPGCGDAGAPDVWFTWTAPAAGTYAIDTLGSNFDTVLDVLMSCTGGSLACNDDGAVDTTSFVTVTLGLHQTVVIVVDGLGGSSGNYVLGIHAVMPEICTDMIDNDGDSLIDCADYTDCGSNPACTETGAECSDTIDNDGDGDIDCADYDCHTEPNCDESMHCDDGIDNDHDGDIDCADLDCSAFSACDESMHCDDFIDNDGDYTVDCADTDCAMNARCTTPETDCNDGKDNDFDDRIDCSDSDCAAHCMENTDALCMNTMDDDGDALVDCADLQCSCSTACPPAVMPSTTCPDMDLGSVMGDGVFHGTIAAYACGARADSTCGTGGLGGEIELAWKAPADGYYTFDTNDTSHMGNVFDTVVSIRTSCDATSTELDCSNDGGIGHLSDAFVSLMANQTVIIVIDANNVWDGGDVTLNIHSF